MAFVQTNNNFAWFAGPEDAISEEGWANGPSLAELQSLENHSAGIKVDGTDFNVEASEQVDDRSFADEAGAQSRGALQASGNIEPYVPGKGDSTSVHAKAYDRFAQTRAKLALFNRPVKPQATSVQPGDEINIFRVVTDDRTFNRNDASRTTGVGLKLQDDIFPNYIVPASTPAAVVVTPLVAGEIQATLDEPLFLRATYQGRNVTVGAEYISSDESVFIVTPGGVLVGVSAGEADLTVSIAGSAAGSAIPVTVAP